MKTGGGIGLVFAPLENGVHLGGIDLDTCRGPATGNLTPWAEEVIDRFKTYTEVSPSQTGVKLFFVYAQHDHEISSLLDGKNGRAFKRPGGEHPPGIEVYLAKRYFAVTDDEIGDFPALRQVSVEDLRWLITEAGPTFAGVGNCQGGNGSRDNSRSAKAFNKILDLKARGFSYEEARDALLKDLDSGVAAWAHEKGMANGEREMRRAYDNAAATVQNVTFDDFYAYMPSHSYIFTPSREMWPAASINARIGPVAVGDQKISASTWLDRNKPVEQMTWAPGEPMLIQGRLISDGGWIGRKGVTCFNLYRPPVTTPGNADEAGPWIEHANNVFGDDAAHIIKWLAHRVQRPQEKINHALVFGGCQGSRPAPARENQSRACLWRLPRHRQRHIAGTGEARCGAMEFCRSLAAANTRTI